MVFLYVLYKKIFFKYNLVEKVQKRVEFLKNGIIISLVVTCLLKISMKRKEFKNEKDF